MIDGVDTKLKEIILAICKEASVDIIEMGIMPDHVHLLLEVDTQFGFHRAVKTMKEKTSRILRQEFPWPKSRIHTLWTNSYFCFTVGGAPIETIRKYIENQGR